MATEDRAINHVAGLATRQYHDVDFPGGGRATLLLLSCAEAQDALVAAREHLRTRGLDLDSKVNLQLLADEQDVQLVYRMTLQAGARITKARLFKSADETRERLNIDQRQNLIAWHLQYQEERAKPYRFPGDPEPVEATEDAAA